MSLILDGTSGITTPGITNSATGTEPPRTAAYQWTSWNPSDVAGTLTSASSTAVATVAATNYMTMANSSGTVTFTFTKAGNYLVTCWTNTNPQAAVDSNSYSRIDFGGTATRLFSETTVYKAMDISPMNFGANLGTTFLAVATANQTVTIHPKVAVTRAAGSAANYPTYAEATATYVGTT